MKAAAVILHRTEELSSGSYERLMSWIKSRLELCIGNNIAVIVFPALLGCLFAGSHDYIGDICKLSEEYRGAAICPGSIHEKDSAGIYHSSCIVKDGSILLKQRQLYLAKWEKAEGLSRGRELETAVLGGLKTAIMLSTDMFYPQVARALALAGAELVLAPAAIIGQDNGVRQLSGLWQNVQANMFFAVESGFKGSWGGYEYNSRSIIHAPLEMTDEYNGYLAIEDKKGTGTLVTAELDNERRREAVKKFDTLAQLNRDAYKSIFSCKANVGSYD